MSYSEKPRIVRNATTVAGVTSKPVTEYTPTLISTSWTIATIAEIAIRHSNRQAMNSATSTRNTTRARTALVVMLAPHVELTELLLTADSGIPASEASAMRTARWVSSG